MPIRPFLLTPAYRHGSQTPWGGNRLKSIFHKDIPDERTGESLEMSVIPGLDSRNGDGVPLAALIDRYGAALVGEAFAHDAFPLLLKLIDAREQLSVQVHPDDAYAQKEEEKKGKTEAWVILDAAPGAQIVYGVAEGVTREALRNALALGNDLRPLMCFVDVHPGDVFYIPAGMIHAIGGGILLYEIQQSSDITYRLYDWQRKDAQGRSRQLHIRQALDVARFDLDCRPAMPKACPDARCQRELLLDTQFFTLQRLRCAQGVPFAKQPAFSVLTTLADASLIFEDTGETLMMAPGQTLFLPADCAPCAFTCAHALLSAPAHKTAIPS